MLSARWEANDNKLQCKLTLWIGKHVFFKYFTVKLHVNLIRDIDTLERYSKDFKSITKFGELLLLASRDPRKAKMQWVYMERGRGTRARVSPCPTRPRRLRFLPSAFHSTLRSDTTLCSPISSLFESSVESLEGTKRLTGAPASAESCECPEARSRDWACLGW